MNQKNTVFFFHSLIGETSLSSEFA